MLRYCNNCKKEFDFKIKSIKDLNSLTCPECGKKIDPNSRNIERIRKIKENESNIGNTIGNIYGFAFIFYLIFAIIGIIAYFTKQYNLLYISSGINILVFLIQFFTGTLFFYSGLIFLPLGAVGAYFIFGGLEGACLGIQIVFALRHIIRDIFFRFIFWIISKI